MKKQNLFLVSLCLVLLVGCAKPKSIMPAVEYSKPIDFHVDRNASIYWEIGQQNTSKLASKNEGVVANVIESIDRQNNPSRYHLSYGKAEQAIFITSFRNILERQAVFRNVELVTEPKKQSPKDVLITIYFRSTRVSSPERGYQISLSVDMSVKAAGKPNFTRTYFVKSDMDSFGTFQEQQSAVSKKLAENLINGLKQWNDNK